MKQLFFLLLAVTSAQIATAQTQSVCYPGLSKTLDSLASADQRPMQEMMRRGQMPDSTMQRLVAEEKATFARHQPVLEAILCRYCYPGVQQVGEQSATNFWLLVQHADAYPEFQRQVLHMMLMQVALKNINPINYAYLTDRVAENAGQPQEYGTQVNYEGTGIGKAVPKSLRDPTTVNKRRAMIGMEPLESYLDKVNRAHEEMNKPHSVTN
ncbi:DUF6624 domain-containing protein [Hymenobacter sp. PAMC 26628]|uniref:DUF6624 domain-containing protein n=1 Tax=Hymenobacter sp. PAMC 26628 TaxID=1484118 RepID=UPI00077026F5|nr:DUF6624 domain-containing protein [Hymenobacter sp. PAMC 26628]AMJ65276.1 hypothetical protein AXW84_07430 [Hymenobacter sp. PAMC 26628]